LPTATPRPAFGPVQGSWSAVPGLQRLTGSVVIAQSSPNVVYETVPTQSDAAPTVGQSVALRRSDNDGGSWRTLATPRPTNSAVASWTPTNVLVSPADPNVVAITVVAVMSYNVPKPCPADLTLAYTPPASGTATAGKTLSDALPLNGFATCSAQYLSTDGGVHWTKIAFTGVQPSADGLQSLAEQPGHLYSTMYSDDQQGPVAGYRLLSGLGGASWQPIDAALRAQGRHICGFVAVPMDTTLYAETTSEKCYSYTTHPEELWRSDDAGATWRDIGSLTGQLSVLGAAEEGPYDAQPTLYVYTVSQPDLYALHLEVSTDGGYSWQSAPSAGIPTGFTPVLHMTGMLSDGSLVAEFSPNPQAGPNTPVTIGFYAWHAGDSAWHQVAPAISIPSIDGLSNAQDQFLATPSGGVHGTIWHTQFNPLLRTGSFSVERYSL
ncbi:MAG: hypothetical protein ACRDHP_03600, partial [Ktedonobacterales bacterium]